MHFDSSFSLVCSLLIVNKILSHTLIAVKSPLNPLSPPLFHAYRRRGKERSVGGKKGGRGGKRNSERAAGKRSAKATKEGGGGGQGRDRHHDAPLRLPQSLLYLGHHRQKKTEKKNELNGEKRKKSLLRGLSRRRET